MSSADGTMSEALVDYGEVVPVTGSLVAPDHLRFDFSHTKPMTAEEAVLALSDDDNQFLVFRDADTGRLGVIYKRKDGNYGLIEP